MALSTLRYDSPIYNLQIFLRTISQHYPEIPNVLPDGVYGTATANAVEAFQKKFMLNQTGVTNFDTWDTVVAVYKDIIGRERRRTLMFYPEEGLSEEFDSFIPTVMIMQSMMSALSQVFSNIPPVDVTGVIDEATINSIKAIQYISGLNPDGNITSTFSNYLSSIYEAYISVNRTKNAMQITNI